MNSEKEILAGSEVTLHFSLSLPDGTEAISTFADEPMTFIMGDGSFQQGMELSLYGLNEGAEQTLTLTPEQAYGYPDEQMIHDMPVAEFDTDQPPQVGQIIAFSLPNGEEMPGMIIEVNEEYVRVDFNHPLSGHDVVFKVKILHITQPGFAMNTESDDKQ
jgi:FKBP-type peptidyl-prolyl cis-trans isomerase SlpA